MIEPWKSLPGGPPLLCSRCTEHERERDVAQERLKRCERELIAARREAAGFVQCERKLTKTRGELQEAQQRLAIEIDNCRHSCAAAFAERDEARRVAAAFEQSLAKMRQERNKLKEKLYALYQYGPQACPQAPVEDQVYQSGLHDAGVVLVTQEPVDLSGAADSKGSPAPEELLVRAAEGSLPVADDKELEARLESAQAYRGACERLYKRHLADLEAARRLCEGTRIMLNRAQGSVLAFEGETSRRRSEGFSRRGKER